MAKTINSLFIILLFCSCLQEQKEESKELDNAMLNLQRMAMWHREYYFHVIRWRGKNPDSTDFYEKKMDSALVEYQYYMRKYNDLVEEHKKQKGN